MEARVGSRHKRLQWKRRLKHKAKRMTLKVRKPEEMEGQVSSGSGGSTTGGAGGFQQSD